MYNTFILLAGILVIGLIFSILGEVLQRSSYKVQIIAKNIIKIFILIFFIYLILLDLKNTESNSPMTNFLYVTGFIGAVYFGSKLIDSIYEEGIVKKSKNNKSLEDKTAVEKKNLQQFTGIDKSNELEKEIIEDLENTEEAEVEITFVKKRNTKNKKDI